MERIMIIGCCGSGKTTLARKLGAILDLPVVHLDRLYWTGNWQTVSDEEFDSVLKKELEKPRWIIDGNYNRTMMLRLSYCDTIIYLDYGRFTCMMGVIKRVIKGYGKTRPDMGGNCPERFDLDFLKFVWNFNKSHRERYYKLLHEEKERKIIILKNRRECAKFIEQIEQDKKTSYFVERRKGKYIKNKKS